MRLTGRPVFVQQQQKKKINVRHLKVHTHTRRDMHTHTAQCSNVIYHLGEKHLGSSQEAACFIVSLRFLCKLSAEMDISHNHQQVTTQSAAPAIISNCHSHLHTHTSIIYQYFKKGQGRVPTIVVKWPSEKLATCPTLRPEDSLDRLHPAGYRRWMDMLYFLRDM